MLNRKCKIISENKSYLRNCLEADILQAAEDEEPNIRKVALPCPP